MDFDRTYTSSDIRKELFFSSHTDLGGVELHLPGESRTLKLTVAAAEDLLENLKINTEWAREVAKR